MTLAKAGDLALGLILTILIVAAVCSGVTEAIASLLKKRAKDLWNTIVKLVEPAAERAGNGNPIPAPPADARPAVSGDKPHNGMTVTQALYNSPFVMDASKAARGGKTQIAHLASNEFAQGLIHAALAQPEAVAAKENDKGPLEQVVAGLGEGSQAGTVISQLAAEATNDVDHVIQGLEKWFDAQMARLARVYRNWSRLFALIIALLIAIGANVDLVFIARQLNSDDALRTTAASTATKLVTTCKDKSGDALTSCVDDNTGNFTLPVGWSSPSASSFAGWNKLWKPIGWLLTAFAAMWGAPFWFDLLKRITGLRTGSGSGGTSGSTSGSG
jgi:hypothetical protein